jgi:uncharacterized protein YdaU (DUF1376 family)
MTDLPYQEWFESDFANDTRTMPFELRCVYRAVLQVMWSNHGWLPGDDVICAHMLGCDPRTWRAYKQRLHGRLQAEIDPVCGPIFRQKRVSKDWANATDRRAKAQARTAPARAERSRKSAERRSAAVLKLVTSNSDSNRDRNGGLDSGAPARVTITNSPTSPRGDVGDGPLTPGTVGPPAAVGAGVPTVPVERVTGPFMPSPAAPPRPAQRSAFLEAYEQHQLTGAPLPMVNGAPPQRDMPKGDGKLWDEVNAKFAPGKPPEPTSEHAKAVLTKPKEEQHERQPDADEPKLDPDDLDDLIRF